MTRHHGLRRQIVLSLIAMALGVILLSVVGSYVFYALASTYSPDSLSETWMPSGIELAWIVGTTVAALTLAGTVAVRLSRRILTPLNAVADGLRDVAQGKLQARARLDEPASGETAQLVRDFNALAERLQSATREQEFWNAAVAHELRTPVTILRGRLQGLVDGVFSPGTELFEGLLRQVEGLNRLIEDLRVLSLNDSGHLELDLVPSDLAHELADVAQAFSESLAARGLMLRVDIHAPLPVVVCDVIRIRQALMALLENALRHATPGLLRVSLEISAEACELQVEDSGPGIPQEMAVHVFEAFRRGDPSRSRRSGGSGLGLAVVRAIVEVHGGHAACWPGERGGTVFSLRWPAVRPQAQAAPD
ncbi:ATP-binding protein [Pseudomonas sp. S 311-6]|nr:ATP-binding protein [Kerstersia gyiorum]MCO7637698.1 ATP-binding protein [Pseudomonas sp. S 311-6]MCP1634555.1 two-component system sensor histidine kinase AdeS [Kerstersia gyiorum]MCP1637969.1 two-component system sensor histidine kinase AdeS [Kerstersia gyiorum]MCP1672349.1 two-component system sensor histidine kinase AdeS [Kerstersia gyiorum]MCP1680430.1 two-component system sensor histidine kinase AdeS [Kerstersia gyiorum]